MSPDATDRADPLAWFKTLTYAEIHAFQIGAALTLLAAAAASPTVLGAYLAIALWALGLRGSPRRSTRTGSKKSESAASEPTDGTRGSGLAQKFLVQIRAEVHYFLVGGIVGDRVGATAHYVWFGTFPDHYEQLPEIVRALVGVGV